MGLKTYFDFAENDYQYLQNTAKDGYVANTMGALAAGVCEKYLKHLTDRYVKPASLEESTEKTAALRTHNLKRLVRYLEGALSIRFTDEVRAAVNEVDGYYFSTRYPGDEAIELTAEDIQRAVEATRVCREFVLAVITGLEEEQSETKEITK
ncbi:MAG: HEPN domain-containing protein [Firmicutes bacterium]|nr:HEPN domain-containing protein [Bacillota bacterium]